MSLKVGIVDYAGWFYPGAYMSILNAIEDVDLVAGTFLAPEDVMQAVNGTGRDHYVESFGVTPYDDVDKMVRDEGLDAVCVFGEYSRKADLVEAAARTGVHVFVTKPPAVTLDQMKRIVDCSRECSGTITVPEHTRFNAMFRRVHELVKKGRLGNIVSARAVHQHGSVEPLGEGHWYMEKKNGGPEISLAWYVAGLLRWFVPSEPVRASAVYSNLANDWFPFMDNGQAVVAFASGAVGSAAVHFAVGWPYPHTEVDLIGTKGSAQLCLSETGWTECTLYESAGTTEWRNMEDDSIFCELTAWTQAIGAGEATEMPAEEAMGILSLCIAWQKSAETGQVVPL
jgi:predicted dehydrogenase